MFSLRRTWNFPNRVQYTQKSILQQRFFLSTPIANGSASQLLSRTRWMLIPFATANHVCLGSVFAWSLFNQPLMRLNGVVAPAVTDWTLADSTTTFSLVMGGFAWGFVFSKYLDKLGPRTCGFIGAASLGTGFSLAALAVHLHSLPLLWLGGGVWGLANGWTYIPPVSTLMQWFPQRKGFASGVVLVGYGSGALLAAPLFQYLLRTYQKPPLYLGPLDHVPVMVGKNGALFAANDVEVVVATLHDCQSSFGALNLDPGVYAVGTGSTGVMEAFAILGALYSSVMLVSALSYRMPPPSLFSSPPNSPSLQPLLVQTSMTISQASRTPQYAMLYGGFVCASTGAYGLISCSKLLLSTSFPSLSADQLMMFVAGTSVANLAGRLVYSNMSDVLALRSSSVDPFYGRRQVYTFMWGLAAPLGYLGIYTSMHTTMLAEPYRVGLFCLSVGLCLSSFGGSAANRPAIVSDLFGVPLTSAITARQLSAVLPAAVLGPILFSTLSKRSTEKHIYDLLRLVKEDEFQAQFGGAGLHQVQQLIENRTITIARLLEICPAGTVDPSPFVFDHAIGCAAGLTFGALLLNRLTVPFPATKK